MDISVIGSFITFQVTFTELFIASTVIASVAFKYGWRSAALGSAFGLIAIAAVSYVLGSLASLIPLHILDWISSVLLFGFGLFLYYEFWHAQKSGEGAAPIERGQSVAFQSPINWAGTGIASWGLFAEGLEIMVVWLAISLKQGMAAATLGVLIGLIVIGFIAAVMRKLRIFEKIPPKYLDLIAGTLVTIYGIYFFYEAIKGTFFS